MYLIDTSSLVDAKRRLCSFDILPGLWDWVNQQHNKNELASIEAVYNEISQTPDALSEWAKNNKHFFLPPNLEVEEKYRELCKLVMKLKFNQLQKNHMLNEDEADLKLIAHAQALSATVVTEETQGKPTLNIPYICNYCDINCCNLISMLKNEEVKFVLGSTTTS